MNNFSPSDANKLSNAYVEKDDDVMFRYNTIMDEIKKCAEKGERAYVVRNIKDIRTKDKLIKKIKKKWRVDIKYGHDYFDTDTLIILWD